MISLLTPTRGRPTNMLRLCKSVEETAYEPNNIEIIFYIDIDDTESEEQFQEIWNAGFAVNVYACIGKRIILSETWNKCLDISEGPYYMLCADDIVFRTKDWDTMVLNKFEEYPDKIVLVHGKDGFDAHIPPIATHPFLHKNWIDIIGYFCPPLFSCDYNDKWLSTVADIIKRRVLLPELLTEHMHPNIMDKDGKPKATADATHRERMERGKRENVDKIWRESTSLVRADAYKLLQVIGRKK